MKKTSKINQWMGILSLSVTVILCAFTSFRNEQGMEHTNVVSYQTPIDTTKSGAIWSCSLSSSGTTSYNSLPILTEQGIYIANSDKLYELDYKGNIHRQLTLRKKINSVSNMLLENQSLYVPLNGGAIECIDISTMTSRWISETFGGQSLSTLFYYDEHLYAASTLMNSRGTEGTFYCLNALNGSTVWTYHDSQNPGGYYWSGAIVHDNALYFSGDNGILVSHSLKTNEIYDTYSLSTTANIRAGITYDKQSNAMYTVSNDGMLYKIHTNSQKITDVTSASLTNTPSNVNCTSTPTIYQGRIYTGLISKQTGLVSVMDATSLKVIYEVQGPAYGEIKSSPLISTRGKKDGTVYVYVTANGFPGTIYYFVDTPKSTNGTLQTLFTPNKSQQQFCISSIVAGKDGTLYYSNDSGTLFAVNKLLEEPSPSPTSKVQMPSITQEPKTRKVSVKKPYSIKIKKKKNKFTLIWKNSKKNETILYTKYGSGKWKKNIIKKKHSFSLKRKRKTIGIRLRSRKKVNGKWHYSGYTKTFHLK